MQVFEKARDFYALEECLQIEVLNTYFEEITSKQEIEYLNKNIAAVIEHSLFNLNMITMPILDENNEGKLKATKIVTMIMLTLYNLRHQYKVLEESEGNSSPRKSKGLRKRFDQTQEMIQNL